jgi:hypothetical protein
MSVAYSKPRTRLNPFSEPMKAWWVECYIIKHYTGEAAVNTKKREGTFAPTPDSIAGAILKAKNPKHFEDPRLKDLRALEEKYRDPSLSRSERRKVVEVLWPLVDILIKEGRVTPPLPSPPMEAGGSLQEIRDALVEVRAIINTIRFDLNVLRNEARNHGWSI